MGENQEGLLGLSDALSEVGKTPLLGQRFLNWSQRLFVRGQRH
jgi:hypothetical protein